MYYENHIGGEYATHGMPNEDDISIGTFMRFEPLAELVPGNLYRPIRLIARIQLAVDNVCL